MRDRAPSVRFAVALLAGSLVYGCELSPVFNPNCTDELSVALGPQDTILSLGATVAPRVTLSTCGGRVHPPARVALTSADPAVIHVGTNPLRLEALSAGLVLVEVVDSTYGSLGALRLTVATSP